ncbi:MAG: hypothetical protein ABIU63_04470 [Chitinophagaceae bacterium]
MKHSIFLLSVLAFSLSLCCQQRPRATYSRYDDYMQRSRRKQKAGIIFLTTGAAVAAGGTILLVTGINRNNSNNNTVYDELSAGEVQAVAGGLITVVGIGAMCGSIPFFVGAHRSRAKAMSVFLKTEKAPLLFKSSFSSQLYPALAIGIPLGR